MKNKNEIKSVMRRLRLCSDANSALNEEVQRTGKRPTRVVEDHLLWKRLFGEAGNDALKELCDETGREPRQLIEALILFAAKKRK